MHKSSAPSVEGKRRGLGPGGTRGTIELLCRGGGQIAAQEVPTVVGHKKTSNECADSGSGSVFIGVC